MLLFQNVLTQVFEYDNSWGMHHLVNTFWKVNMC